MEQRCYVLVVVQDVGGKQRLVRSTLRETSATFGRAPVCQHWLRLVAGVAQDVVPAIFERLAEAVGHGQVRARHKRGNGGDAEAAAEFQHPSAGNRLALGEERVAKREGTRPWRRPVR